MTNWNFFDAPADSYDAMLAAKKHQEEYEQQGQASTSKTKLPDKPSRRMKGKARARDEWSDYPKDMDSDSEPEYTKPWRPSPPSSPEPNPLRMPPPHSFNAPLRTSLDMPVPGSKEAPRTFRGKYHEVERFIRHLEHLFTKNRVVDEKERCTLLLDYCTTNVQNVIRTMEYFRVPRWAGLRREILRMFDAERTQHKYRPADVVNFAKEMTKKQLTSMTQWRRYSVKYNVVAGGPYAQGRLSEENYLCYFWLGIPKDLRTSLETRILQGRSLQDPSQYSMREINIAAEWHFRRTRAETLLLDATEFGFDEYNPDENSDSDSDASDSDSDYERRRPRKNKRSSSGARRTHEAKGKVRESKMIPSKSKVKFTGNEEEIAGMIKQLNGMKIDDPDYASTYYKVLALDQTGIASKCVKSPAGIQSSMTSPGFSRRTSYSSSALPPRPQESTIAPLSTPPVPSAATYPNNIPLAEQECFGCHGKGHRADRCDELNALIARGVLTRHPETRRIQWTSGAQVRRYMGESILQAVTRATKGQTSSEVLLTFMDDSSAGTRRAVETFYQTIASVREGESDESDWTYLTIPKMVHFEEDPGEVYEAERTIPSTRVARQATFKGVYPPARPSSTGIAPLSRTPPRSSPRSTSSTLQPPPPPITVSTPTTLQDASKTSPLPSVTAKQPSVRPPTPPKSSIKRVSADAEITPVDVRTPRTVDVGDEDEAMPMARPIRTYDMPIARDPVDPERRPTVSKQFEKEKIGPHRAAPARQSAISATVNRGDVTNRALDARIEVSLRELLEVSKDVRADFTDMIRVRNPKAVLISMRKMSNESAVVGNYAWPRTDGILIRVDMVTGDSTICAIIDTGSQLNVVRGEAARQKIKRVVDTTCVIKMNDANGGSGQLRGMIRGAEFFCGGLRTEADLWVSEQAPFDLLLGRPWQRANKVSIDERREGTYLVFKDAVTGKPRFEMLASPAEGGTEEPSVHYQSVTCLHVDKELTAKNTENPSNDAIENEFALSTASRQEHGSSERKQQTRLSIEWALQPLFQEVRRLKLVIVQVVRDILAVGVLIISLIRQYAFFISLGKLPSSFDLQSSAMEIRLPPTPPTQPDDHRLLLMPPPPIPNPTIFPLHPQIESAVTTQTDSDAYDAVQILVSLRNATIVPPSNYPSTQIVPTSLEMNPENALMGESSSILVPTSTPSSFASPRPTLPRRDSPFPYLDENQFENVRRRQLEVLDTRVEEWVPSTQGHIQLGTTAEFEDELEDTPMDVEAVEPTQVSEPLLELRQTDLPTLPTTHQAPVVPTTEAVNAAIQELGLPVERPPTVFHRHIFQQPTRFNAATYTILRHYLPEDPHLQAMAEKIVEFQATAPNAERLALLRDVLAAFVRLIMRRVEEVQAQAQDEMGDEAVHAWTLLLDALYWSHEKLADETSAALEAVLGIATEYGALLEKITESIDQAHQRELSAYYDRLNATTPGPSPLSTSSSILSPVEDFETLRESPNEPQVQTIANGQLATIFEEDEDWYHINQNDGSQSERELAQRMLNMQVVQEERDERIDGLTTVTRADVTTQQPPSFLSADFGEYGPAAASPPSFSFDDYVVESVAGEELASETVFRSHETHLEQTTAESPSRLVLGELFEEFDQLHEAGEHRSARRIFQRAFAYVLHYPFLPDDGNHDVFSDDEQPEESTPSDVNETWVWQRPSQTAIETLDSVQRTEEEYTTQLASPDATLAASPAVMVADTAFVFAAWPQGALQSTVPDNADAMRSSYALQFGSTTSVPIEFSTSRPSISPSPQIVPHPPPPTPVALRHVPPTPVVPRHIQTVPRTMDGPEWWDRPRINFADNNPWYQNFRPRPDIPYDPFLPLETYAKKGAFARAPLNATGVAPLGTTVTGRPSFTAYLADLRRHHHPHAPPDTLGPQLEKELAFLRCQPIAHEGVVFSALRSALHHAFDPQAMGQLLDHGSINAANGYRLAYLYDYHQRPIYVDPTREDAELQQTIFRGPHFDLVLQGRMARNRALVFIRRAMHFLILNGADPEHGLFQWYQDHSWATRRRFYGTHPFLHPHERALGEILWSQLVEFGYHDQANEWGKFLNVRYVCDDVLENFLEMGWLDIVPEAGFEGYWTRELSNLVYDESTIANDSDDEYPDFASDNAEVDSDSSGGFSYFSQADYVPPSDAPSDPESDSDSNVSLGPFRTSLPQPFNLILPATNPAPAANDGGDTTTDHAASLEVITMPVTSSHDSDGEDLVNVDVREVEDGWYDYASDGGSWA
ncbi:hypothetical protein C8F01DRAFT_1244205 [Mycena amicta]|nr:hypothetical protein C8F01DRAFT_1244205 [Mycena amicta]